MKDHLFVTIVLGLALVGGSLLLVQCTPPGEVIEGATLLYFYADW